MRLKGRKALVTGASRGIGRAIALAFAEEGADLAVTARRAESLEETVAAIAATGRGVCPLAWDVGDVSQAEARVAEAKEKLGGLDVVVNNAGVNRRDKSKFPDLTEAEWDYIMDINLKGLYFVCQAAAKVMQEQQRGNIINIASDAGLRGESAPYGISKWGVIGLTKGMAKALSPHGIRVNAIAPGPVTTAMMNWQPGQSMEAPSLPLGRYSLPEEIAAAAVFLASDDSSAVVGDIMVINSANR